MSSSNRLSVMWRGSVSRKAITHASDYFEQIYQFAEALIRDGKAYICSLILNKCAPPEAH